MADENISTLFLPFTKNCHHLLIYFGSLFCKQYAPRSDSSFRSSLIGAHSVCFHEKSSIECILDFVAVILRRQNWQDKDY